MADKDTDGIKSPNSKENRMLKVESESNIEVSDAKQRTSSDLMYCEYVNTSGSERVGKLFEKKKEKPVMVSYGESPIYKKYSDLLKKLEESKDVLPPENDDKLPIIEMEVFLKQNVDDDSDSNDDENGRIIFCDGKDDSTTDEETSENDDDDIPSTDSTKNVQTVSKEKEQCLELVQLKDTNSTTVNSLARNCKLDENCISVSEKTDNEPVLKKIRLD